MVHSIQRKLKKLPVIIRESDKSGILHIGYKSDYDRKVLLYQEKDEGIRRTTLQSLDRYIL